MLCLLPVTTIPAGSCAGPEHQDRATWGQGGQQETVPEPCPAPGVWSPGLHIPNPHNLGSASAELHPLSLPILDIPHLSSPYPPPAFWGLYIPDLQHLWCSHARSPTSLVQHPSFPQSGSPTSPVFPVPDLSTVSLLIPALPHSGVSTCPIRIFGRPHPSVTTLGCYMPEKQVYKYSLQVRGQTGPCSMGKNPSQQSWPPVLPPHCLRGWAGGSAHGVKAWGAEEGVSCGPGAIWPQLAPCPLCPPCPRVPGQDWPYMAEVRPTSPDVS